MSHFEEKATAISTVYKLFVLPSGISHSARTAADSANFSFTNRDGATLLYLVEKFDFILVCALLFAQRERA